MRSSPGSVRSLAAALAVAAGCAPATESRRAAVVGGEPDLDHPSVVAIVAYRQTCGAPEDLVCSGVAVGERAVLTAAHCLDGVFADELEVITGGDIAAPGRIYAVTGAVVHPDFDDALDPELSADLALLFVDEDLDVTPAALPASLAGELVAGATVRYVGFGSTGPGTMSGRRLGADAVIDRVTDAAVFTGATGVPCGGDSGGALWVESAGGEALAGIVKASGADCAGVGLALRVDAVVDGFAAPAIAGYAAPARPAFEPGADFCGDVCVQHTDCPVGMLCLDDRDAMHCGYRDLRTGVFGDACTSGDDCVRVGAGAARECRRLIDCDDAGGGCDSGCDGGGGGGAALVLIAAAALALSPRRGRR